MLGLDLSAARLADEERPVRRALVVLPPRHMTAALRHRQSRSARLRGQLRPSDDRLAPIAGRGHSPAHHPPADHLSASLRAGRSPARHRRRASPRRHACPHLASRALCGGAERVSLAQTEQRPRSATFWQDFAALRRPEPGCVATPARFTALPQCARSAASCRVGRPAPRRASAARSCGLPPPPPALAPPSPRPPSPQSPRVSTNTLPAATQGPCAVSRAWCDVCVTLMCLNLITVSEGDGVRVV